MIVLKKIIIGVVCAIIVIASIITIFSLYKKNKAQAEQIEILTQQIQEISMEDLVGVVVAKTPIRSGTTVDADSQLQIEQWNRSQVSPNMITDASTIQGKVWKIDVSTRGPITADMVAQEQYGPTDRLQLVLVDAITPSLQTGDYTDFRMITPSGINYVVMAKKRVADIYDAGIEVVMSEAELMVYSGLLIDQYMNPGTMVYTSKYLDPNLQKSNYTMYVPPKEILEYMKVNANMIYPYLSSDDVQGLRSYIESTQPWNLYGPSTFQTTTQSIIAKQEKVTRGNSALANAMKSARSEYAQRQSELATQNGQPAPEMSTGVSSQVAPTTGGSADTSGQYVDSQGVTRDASGNPVINPSDLTTGVTDMDSFNGGVPEETPETQETQPALNSVNGE